MTSQVKRIYQVPVVNDPEIEVMMLLKMALKDLTRSQRMRVLAYLNNIVPSHEIEDEPPLQIK